MNATAYEISADTSRILVRTRCDGMFGFLAHDLELEVPVAGGGGELAETYRGGKLRVTTSAMKIRGVLRGKTLRTDVLSSADLEEIQRRMDAVFAQQPPLEIDVRATLPRARVHLTLGRHECTRTFELELGEPEADGARWVRAKGTLAMSALGLPEVRGPLGAFKVRDDVEVEANIHLQPVKP